MAIRGAHWRWWHKEGCVWLVAAKRRRNTGVQVAQHTDCSDSLNVCQGGCRRTTNVGFKSTKKLLVQLTERKSFTNFCSAGRWTRASPLHTITSRFSLSIIYKLEDNRSCVVVQLLVYFERWQSHCKAPVTSRGFTLYRPWRASFGDVAEFLRALREGGFGNMETLTDVLLVTANVGSLFDNVS